MASVLQRESLADMLAEHERRIAALERAVNISAARPVVATARAEELVAQVTAQQEGA